MARKAGRKTKRTPECEARIQNALLLGNTRKAACRYAGISEDTFADWLKRFPDFSDLVEQAEARVEIEMVSILRKAAKEREVVITKSKTIGDVTITETTKRMEFDWKAALEWLKRRRPKEWGDAMKIGEDPESPMLGTFTAAIEKIYGAKEPEEAKEA